MSTIQNPLMWWVPATTAVYDRAADYFAKMQAVHENTPLAMSFAAGATFCDQSSKALGTMSEALEIDTTPEYTVEAGGVLRPAAWN